MEELRVKDCVGCGFCCLKAPCQLCMRLYPGVRECPELTWNGTRYVCRAIATSTGPLHTNLVAELYIGDGCCCNLNDWRRDVKPRRGETDPKFKKLELDVVFKEFLRSYRKEFISGDTTYMLLSGMSVGLQEKGYTVEQVNEITKEIVYILQDRTKFMEGFMG